MFKEPKVSDRWEGGCRAPVALAALAAALLAAGCNSAPGQAGGASAEASAAVPTVETVRVAQRPVDFVVALPAELRPYQAVAVYPKVTGFVKSIRVDRGSRITRGELLAQLEAPEIVSQESEAAAKLESAQNQRSEAQAKLAGDEDTYKRLETASATPGVISENELEVAQKLAEADKARALGLDNAVAAAKAELHAAHVMNGYLRIEAPFTGIVTARNVHPGALVGPAGGGNAVPMLRIEQISVLRLVVAVPEAYVAGVVEGAQVSFSVPAFPGQTFSGTVARIPAPSMPGPGRCRSSSTCRTATGTSRPACSRRSRGRSIAGAPRCSFRSRRWCGPSREPSSSGFATVSPIGST